MKNTLEEELQSARLIYGLQDTQKKIIIRSTIQKCTQKLKNLLSK